MNEIETNRNIIINNWFYNFHNNNINDSVLILTNSYLAIRLNSQMRLQLSCQIHWPLNSNLYTTLKNKNKNHIVIIDTTKNISSVLEMIPEKLLVISANQETNIKTDFPEYIPVTIKEDKEYLYWLKKEKLSDFIYSNNKNLFHVINTKLMMLKGISNDIDNLITIGINIENFPNENLETDIIMLIKYKILTSRLGVILYRIASLEINANTTKIGRAIHELTGSRSKTFTAKMLLAYAGNNSLTISQDLLSKKSFKAYNLNINDRENTIRIEIATNLLSYNLKNLDMISSATKIPIKIIKEINSQFN